MPTIIGIKDLQNNLKRVADAALEGRAFTVVRDSKPVFRIEPIGRAGGIQELVEHIRAKRFAGPKDLSATVDDVLYGNRR